MEHEALVRLCPLLVSSPQPLTKASQKRRFLFGDGYLLAIDLLIPRRWTIKADCQLD